MGELRRSKRARARGEVAMEKLRKMVCIQCETNWEAVCYEESKHLECPQCGAMNEVNMFGILNIPIDNFWEKDDGVSMGDIIRVERFLRHNGSKSAQIWGAWHRLKQILKAQERGEK